MKAEEDEGNDSFGPSMESIRDLWENEINDDLRDLMKELKSADVIDDLQHEYLECFNTAQKSLTVCASASQQYLVERCVLCELQQIDGLNDLCTGGKREDFETYITAVAGNEAAVGKNHLRAMFS